MSGETQTQADDLHGRVVRGVGWMMGAQVSTQVLALLTSMIVARFLGPHEVGLAAMALVFGSLALVIVDFGFASVLVQRPTLTEEDKSTAFWIGTVLGLALMLIGVALSWPIAAIYGEPRVQPLFAVLSLAFLFTAPGIVQGGLLTRDLKFRSLEIRTITATTASSLVAMTLAVAGAGAWAIVAQYLTITGLSTVLLWGASPWRPRAGFSGESLRGMAAYTSHVFGTRLLAWATVNIDNFLIGRFLGPSQLGAYTIAFSLMVTPLMRIATPLTQVFFPAFSRMRDPVRIGRVWLRATRMLAFVVLPAMFGLMAVAPEFVAVIYGDEWGAAVPVIQILAPVGILQALMALGFGILQAVDRTRTLFRFTLVLSIVTVAAFAAGLPWGIEGVAVAYLAITLVMQPIFLLVTARALEISARAWVESVARVFQAAVAMLAALLAARTLLAPTELGAAPTLALLVALGLTVYLPLAFWRAPELADELRAVRDRRRSATAALETPPAGV